MENILYFIKTKAIDTDFKSIFPILYWLTADKFCGVVAFISKSNIYENFEHPPN